MRIGIVCPYSFDVPGGVQFHVRDLAEHFLAQGHHASVLAPADDGTPLPDYVESVGRAVPVEPHARLGRVLLIEPPVVGVGIVLSDAGPHTLTGPRDSREEVCRQVHIVAVDGRIKPGGRLAHQGGFIDVEPLGDD